MTEPTAPEPAAQERSVPVEKLLAHLREENANLREQVFVTRELYQAAEDECAQLRLRVLELQSAPAAG